MSLIDPERSKRLFINVVIFISLGLATIILSGMIYIAAAIPMIR